MQLSSLCFFIYNREASLKSMPKIVPAWASEMDKSSSPLGSLRSASSSLGDNTFYLQWIKDDKEEKSEKATKKIANYHIYNINYQWILMINFQALSHIHIKI